MTTSTSSAPRTRVSPRKQRNREAILNAAADLFGRHGYSNVSMDTISEAAGVAKPTVYAHFESKEGLFEALLRQMLGDLVDTPPEAVSNKGDIEAALIAYGSARIEWQLDPRTLGLLRAATAEAIRRPAWAQGILTSVDDEAFETWLAEADAKGFLAVPDPAEAARMFWATIKGALFYPVLVGIEPSPNATQRQRVIAEAVRGFIEAHRTGRKRVRAPQE